MVDAANGSDFSFERSLAHLDRDELSATSQRWALAHGFVQRCFAQTDESTTDSNIIPYPFTIHPSPYPRNEYANACRIQCAINHLVQRLAFDVDLMDSVFADFLECDPFVQRLRQIYDHISKLPYQSIAEACIIRTDYMLQQTSASTERTQLRLIEVNTIAVGLGAAAKLMRSWHEKFLGNVQSDPALQVDRLQLPPNESHDLIVDTLFDSWHIYANTKAIILFVVTKREFNIGDQMLIEQSLTSRVEPSPLVKHVTLTDVSQNCRLDSNGTLFFAHAEVALVYYRTAYDPKHFYKEDIWQAYIMLESSRAIKCPSLRYHLAGMKCFQLALTNENFLRTVFQEHRQYIDDLRDITEEMFTIEQATEDPDLQRRIAERPESFYLKQNREGGGNVYCGSSLKERLEQIIAEQQSKRYFLMSRIYAPVHSSLVRLPRSTDNGEHICERRINSELGIFGSLISRNSTLIGERTGGSLLRSKPAANVEGGVASGQGYIDSVYLI